MKSENKVSKFDMIIMFILVGIIPFLIYGTNYEMPISATDSIQLFDYFNYVKVTFIKIVAAVIFFNWVAEFFLNEQYKVKLSLKKLDKKLIFIGLIVISVIIAFLFSEYKFIVTFGAFERFESIWVHFSYAVIFIYSLQFFKKEGSFEIFSYAILLSTFIVGGIGTLQFLGVDVFSSSFIKALTYKNFDVNIVSEGSFTTMYNTNTSASYAVLMMVILLIIFALNKNKIVKAIVAVDFILIAITFYNSLSEAAYIAAAAGVVCFVVLYAASFITKGDRKKIIGFGTVVCVFVVGGIITLVATDLSTKILEKVSPELTFVKAEQDANMLTLLNREDDSLKFETHDGSYAIYENQNLLTEKAYEEAAIDTYETENFGQLTIAPQKTTDGVDAIKVNELFILELKETEPKVIDITTAQANVFAEYIGFENYPNAITNRGYIWSRSLPILLDNLLIGVGSDAYFEYFPNDDNLIQSFMGVSNVTVDKPHSIYLNMAINNGILYIFGFLAIVCLTIFENLKKIFNDDVSEKGRLAVTLYLGGIFAYLVNGAATDNLVIIVMLFWVYLGLSVAINDKEVALVTEKGKVKEAKEVKKVKEKNSEVKNDNVFKNDTVKEEVKEEIKEDIKKENELENSKMQNSENTESKKEGEIDYSEIGVSYHDLMKNQKNNQNNDNDFYN